MEEGLYQEKQKCTKKNEYKINCCTQCIPYLRFIILFEVMLLFGGGCYMILQTYRPKEMKNETINITLDRYPLMVESLSEIQKSRPSTEMPVKPAIIIDKISNILENMEFMEDQNSMQNEAIENISHTQTNTQNSNNVRNNNIVGISAVNRLFSTLSSGNLVHDEKFTKNSVPEKFFSSESIDKNISTDKNDKFIRSISFLEKLLNINNIKATNNLEQFESRNDNHLALERNASNKFENLELNVTTISNPENDFVDHMISVDLTNIFQDPKQEFSDLIKDVAQDECDLCKEIDERVNARLGLDLIIPRYPKFFDMLKDSVTVSSISQSLLAQEISEIENSSDDINEGNEDKHINDSDMLMSASTSGDQDYLFMVAMQNTEEQHSTETIVTIKEDDKYKSTENIKDPFWFSHPVVQDSAEFSTPNIDEFNDFQWLNAPPSFIDLGLGDISKLNEMGSSLLWDTYEDIDVDDVIPGSQCKITIKMDILKVTCPDIKFDEEWNFTLSKTSQIDVPEVINFGDDFDIYLHTGCDENANKKLEVENIFNKNSDKEVTTLQDSVLKIINATELQESTTNGKISNNISQTLLDLLDAAAIEPFNNEEIGQDYPLYDSFYDYPFYDCPFYHFNEDKDFNEEQIEQMTTIQSPSISEFGSSTIDSNKGQNPLLDIFNTQQEQLKVNKGQDYLVPDNIETSLKDFEHFYALGKEQISLLKNEISDIVTRYLSKSSYENNYRNNICGIFRYMHSISQQPWREQYVAFSKLLENIIRNPDYPHSMDDSYRKKRMTDDLTWQQGKLTIILYLKMSNFNFKKNYIAL